MPSMSPVAKCFCIIEVSAVSRNILMFVQILQQMKMLAAETGTALIWISHDLAVVSSLASKLTVMYAGRIVEYGPTAQLLRNPKHPYTKGLIGSLPAMTKRGSPLAQIPGTTPSLMSLPDGCSFSPRCNYASKKCSNIPELTMNKSRAWRCFFPVSNIGKVLS